MQKIRFKVGAQMSQVTLSDTEQTLNPASEAFFLRRRPAIYGCMLVSCLLLSSCSDSKTSSSVSKSKLSSPESSEQDAVVADEDNNTNSKNPQQNAAKLKVLSPNGHEYLIKGKTTSITWKEGNGGKFVTISLLKGGKAYKTVVKKTKNDGDHSWKIPKSIASSSGYKIKVSSFTTKTISDLSNHSFAIEDADTGTGTGGGWTIAPGKLVKKITVTSPNGGEYWDAGTRTITWKSNAGSIVRIDLYNSGKRHSTISSETSDDGSYVWKIPADQQGSNKYQVRIQSQNDQTIFDLSDAYFQM